jgi:hypothetical protein
MTHLLCTQVLHVCVCVRALMMACFRGGRTKSMSAMRNRVVTQNLWLCS